MGVSNFLINLILGASILLCFYSILFKPSEEKMRSDFLRNYYLYKIFPTISVLIISTTMLVINFNITNALIVLFTLGLFFTTVFSVLYTYKRIYPRFNRRKSREYAKIVERIVEKSEIGDNFLGCQVYVFKKGTIPNIVIKFNDQLKLKEDYPIQISIIKKTIVNNLSEDLSINIYIGDERMYY